MALTDISTQNLFILIVALIFIIMMYFEYCYSYWKNRRVPTLPALIPFGHFKPFLTHQKSLGQNLDELYTKLKTYGKPYGGVYMFIKPMMLLIDPAFIKTILTTEFNNFTNRSIMDVDVKTDPLLHNLVHENGEKWRVFRTKLTPIFSSGKMKMMFNTMADVGKQLKDALETLAESGEPFEIQDTMEKYTTDVIASIAFGMKSNSFEDPNNPFKYHGYQIIKFSESMATKRALSYCFPILLKIFKLGVVPKKSAEFIMNLVKDNVDYRKNNNITRKDFLDFIMHLDAEKFGENKSGAEKGNLTLEQMAAQCYLFYVAGFETSSSTLTSVIYHLATNENIQDKVRQEIREVLKKHNGEVSYDAIQELTYTQMVIDETLRMNPPFSFAARECTKDYRVPGENLIITAGTSLVIPIIAIHNDPEYYPNPEVFDPERFNPEEKNKNTTAFRYLPFGHGPRQCIGLRFATMQVKTGLTMLLKDYKMTLHSKTKTPIKEHCLSSTYCRAGGVWVTAKKIE